MKELLIMAKSLGGGGSEVALIELINALPEEHYNVTLVLLDLDSEYAYRLKKRVNIVQLTFNSSFAKSLVSMYAFPAKVLKKLSVNYYIPYYDFIASRVTNVFEKTYDIAIDFYGYGSFVTAFLATKIQAKKKATWLHDEKLYWLKSVQKYLCKYDKVYGVSQAVVDAFCREYPHYKDKAAVFYNVIDLYGMIVSIIKTMPGAPVIMVVVLLTMIAFYATSFDSIALTASCYSYHTLEDGEQPNKGIQLMWCILLILLPIALLFAESSMNNLQSVSIVAAFPIGAVIVMIAVSFMKDAKKYMEELGNKK